MTVQTLFQVSPFAKQQRLYHLKFLDGQIQPLADIFECYEIFGLEPDASGEVKQAYRDLVKVWHPDRFAYDHRLQNKAQEKLKDINEAYQKIQDFLNNFYVYQHATGTVGKRSSKTDELTADASQQSPKSPGEEHSAYRKDYQEPRSG